MMHFYFSTCLIIFYRNKDWIFISTYSVG